MEIHHTNKHHLRVKLIFNPIAGSPQASPAQLLQITKEMQAWRLVPETFLIEPGCDLIKVVKDAIDQGIKMIVVCGGDGTIESVARAMIGTNTILGIIPGGTANNIALSLGIPLNIPSAIALLRNGKMAKIDIGLATVNGIETPLIEVASVGLFSTLYDSGDDIQHGNISRIGDFLSTLINTVPSIIRFKVDDHRIIKKLGHILLVTNMPYIGRHFQVGALNSYEDGKLDVLFFSDLGKLDIINFLTKGTFIQENEDPRIKHFLAKKIVIETDPPMPVIIDGMTVGEGRLTIKVKRNALKVMVGDTVTSTKAAT